MMINRAAWQKFCPCSSTTIISTAPDIISSSDPLGFASQDENLSPIENTIFNFAGQKESKVVTKMAEKLKIVLFYGSTREGRIVERVGTYVKNVVQSQGMDPIIFGKLWLK